MLTVANPGPHLGSQLAFSGLQTGLAIFVWTRFGLLAGAVSYLTMILSCHYPLTLDPGSWYAGSTLFVVLVIAALALYGFAITLPRHVWHAKSAVLDG